MKVLREINRGGFGRVEEVETPSGQRLARKVFDPLPEVIRSSPSGLDKLKKRFEREARTQASLDRDYFIPILNMSLAGNAPWFTMPLAERSLRDELMASRTDLTIPASAFADILNSLEQLHALGFVHRDLKPENVLLHDGRWKLSDFGLVLPPVSSTTRLSSIGSAWGTAAYAAPEQASDFRSVTFAADIYSFGCILHDLFETRPRVPYSRVSAEGPVGCIIEKCTEFEPHNRFKSIPALRSALLTILSRVDALPSPEAEPWADKLQGNEEWNEQELEEFARYLKSEDNYFNQWTIFRAFEDETVEYFYGIDESLGKLISLEYCGWISSSSFDFNYCDVLIGRLIEIFSLGDFDVKVAAIMAGAELAIDHNRWFVMGHVMKLCGPTMDEQLAERLAIEIIVESAHTQFQQCAERLSKPIEDYHPRIAEVLGAVTSAVLKST